MATIQRLQLCDFELTRESGSSQTPWLSTQQEFCSILSRAGVSLSFPKARLNDGKVVPNLESAMLKGLDSARAAVCDGPSGFLDFASVYERMIERIEQGMRVWVIAPGARGLKQGIASGCERSKRFADLMSRCGVELSSVGLFDYQTEFDHPRSFSLDRGLYRAGFRDAQLFRGIEKVVFQHAHGLRLHADAQGVAAVDPRRYRAIEMSTDLPADWNEPDVSLMSTTYIGRHGGCVLVTSGLLIGDPFAGATGYKFPGGTMNEAVIKNLLNFLFPPEYAPRLGDELEVHGSIQKIERNLLEFIRATFGGSDDAWAHFVAEGAREKARKRAEMEGSGFSWQVYLDLSDHLNTIVKNLGVFGPIFHQLGMPASRNKIEREVFCTGELMRLRILDSHETKRALTGHAYSERDLLVLREIDQRLVRLCNSVTGIR